MLTITQQRDAILDMLRRELAANTTANPDGSFSILDGDSLDSLLRIVASNVVQAFTVEHRVEEDDEDEETACVPRTIEDAPTAPIAFAELPAETLNRTLFSSKPTRRMRKIIDVTEAA